MDRQPGEILIEAQNLHRSFDEAKVQALRGVNLRLHTGELIAVAGPSGCGKSTLLQILGALDDPDEGEIFFRGESLRRIRDRALFRAKTIGFIFQSFHLLPTLSAVENVQIPMFEMPWSPKERRDRAVDLLEAVGLAGRLSHLPCKLSGGERQRVAIARSLANNPELLLADEPTGHLDSVNAARVMELLWEIHCKRRMAIVIVTHDLAIARSTDRVVQMLDGRVLGDH